MNTATKYQKYPKYKPSGIDWLGDIPNAWEAKRLRYYFDYHAGGVWGDEEKGDQNDLFCLRVADFDFDHFRLSTNDLTTRNIPENQHALILEKGDILLEKSGGGEKQTVGRAVRFDSNDRSVCSNFIEKLTPFKVFDSKYISYLMGALYFGTINVRSIKQTTGIQNLDIYSYFSEVVTFPEKTIQKSIADFLDRETSKIDGMVAKKQKMVELLKEKRQALITHAVTKGLDPKAKMKSSSIDWLDDIPEGWEVKRAKYLGRAIIGLTYSPDEVVNEDEGILILRSSNIQNGLIELNDNVYVKKEIPEDLITKTGDILICSRNGSVRLIGKNVLIDESTANLSFGAFMTIFRSKHCEFLYYFFNSSLFISQTGLFSTSTINQLTTSILNNMEIPVPPTDTQREIVEYLKNKTAKIDEMMKKVELQIQKLQEYRQALITSSITGKIMVN